MSDFKLSPPGFDAQALAQVRSSALPRTPTTKSPGAQGETAPGVEKAAQDFEGVFLSQMLTQMWTDVDTDPNFGGGEAEKTWRGMMTEEYGKQIAKAGGVGISSEVKQAMLRMQEQAQSSNPLAGMMTKGEK
ncbi:rod-binding protein [Niveispirillum sp. BGYR6]|uniref:rod-binding protein n=1 Tax=Niveispirillum sp. BGYR6 TaxID=2971249 RepID=UPI0022B9BF65|nr:rod-binding protein [Niveispirillum sp. BGYR6]MDG5493485.1 rod-binding protein [Niveispirillum sp. BGYR6]